MEKELLEELLAHALNALIEHNGGSIEATLDKMGVQDERDQKVIKDWYGWDEELDEETDLHTYYVMYWNDCTDEPVAVFEVNAEDEDEAEDIAFDNGGDAYADDWPVLVETELSESQLERYKNSVWTKYKVVE